MPRDKDIRKSFEITDDGMQGIIGYFFYVIACKESATSKDISIRLPENQIQITVEWVRFYNQQDLIQIMESCFELYHARTCLISLISIFETALKRFIGRLNETRHISNNQESHLKHYKKSLSGHLG